MKSDKKTILGVIALLFLLLSVKVTEGSSSVQKKIIISGHSGSGPGQVGFKVKKTDAQYEAAPSAIAVDTTGNIYIADIANERVLKYDQKGVYLKEMKYKVKEGHAYQIIDDLASDPNDNLYVASREMLRVDKYSPDGKLILSIDLSDKDIYWRENKGWTTYPIQIESMMIDIAGNIYLQGKNELIKISPNGNIEKKWAGIRVSFLDEAGNLYLMRESTWEKYDQRGNLIETLKCEKPLFRMATYGQCLPPQYIDKNGNLYFYEFSESGLTSKGKDRYVKIDKSGKRYGEYDGGGFTGANRSKFDMNGNLYFLLYKDDRFWVEKITWK